MELKKLFFKLYLILIKYFLAYIGRVTFTMIHKKFAKKNVCKLLYASLTPIFCLKNKKNDVLLFTAV